MTAGRWVRAIAAAAVVAGSWYAADASATSPSRCPVDQACVAVIVDGAVVRTFSPSQVEAGDIQGQPVYQVRQPHGTTCADSDPIAAGSSIYSLLREATVSLTDNGHVEVASPGVASIDLTAAQVSANGDGQFYNGQIPVVYGNGGSSSLAFIRGLLASPAPCPPAGPEPGADSNAGAQGDFFGVAEIDLTVYGGSSLGVTLAPAPVTTPIGKNVGFIATIGPGSADASYTYHWLFGDGGAATTTVNHVTYPYDVAGAYVAQVSVDGSDGTTGISAPDPVTVGSKPATGGATPQGGGRSPTPGPSTGPTRGNGHRGAAPAASSRTGVDTHATPGHRRRVERRTTTSSADLTEVSGQLLGRPRHFVATPVSDSAPLVVGSAPSAAAASGNSSLALWCGIAVAALLVAAGAARELRSGRR